MDFDVSGVVNVLEVVSNAPSALGSPGGATSAQGLDRLTVAVLTMLGSVFALGCYISFVMLMREHKDYIEQTNERLLALRASEEFSVPLTAGRPLSIDKSLHTSIAESRVVPTSAKLLIPLCALLCLCLFVVANTTTGARVVFKADDGLIEFDLFAFSLVNTIDEMFSSKVYVLGVMVLAWSGVWPYVKLFLMLVSWYVPPKIVSVRRRRHLVLALDALGKWAIMDVFLIALMTVAFRFHVESEFALKPFFDATAKVDVIVEAEFGLFCFITAAALSMCLSHAIVVFHRNAAAGDLALDRLSLRASNTNSLAGSILDDFERRTVDEETAEKANFCLACPEGSWFDQGTVETFRPEVSLRSKELSTKLESLMETIDLPAPRFVVYATSAAFPFLILMILISATMDSFEFVFGGLAGEVLKKYAPEEVVRRESLFSVASALSSTQSSNGDLGRLYLTAAYLTFSFVFPCLHLVVLFFVYVARSSLRTSKILFAASEIVCAWSALDVFVVSILVSVLQINQFSKFLEGPLCAPIVQALSPLGITECLVVDTTLLDGLWVTLCASVTVWVFGFGVSRAAERRIAFREREVLDAL